MKMLKQIREKIQSKTTISAFSEDAGIRQATLSDFLNGKVDIRVSTLEKITSLLDMSVSENLPGKLYEVQSVFDGKRKYKKGGRYKGGSVLYCFGHTGTSYQMMVVGTTKNEQELVIL